MQTKCTIARKVADEGIAVWIANGKREGILTALVADSESAPSTYFEPANKGQ
jgi:glutamate 5-kinase